MIEHSTLIEGELPPALMTSEPGSFARSTIVERKPQIIRRVIADNGYPPVIVQALETLFTELAEHPVQLLTEEAADTALWKEELAPYAGRTWRELPWYLAETYFYRRLLEAVRYLQPGPWEGRDPFAKQKRREEDRAVALLAAGWDALAALAPDEAFTALLHSSLWGNRIDLSHHTAAPLSEVGLATEDERRFILVDHTRAAGALLRRGVRRVDFVNDNAGMDLLFDLALADFLLERGWAREVVFHLKDRPFFVSDAMPSDARALVALLRAASSAGARALGVRLDEQLAAGQLALREDPYWTSCLMFRHLSQRLRAELERTDLTILKGDVNYRRLLDDRHWPPTTPLEVAAGDFPRPFLALRTLKAELVVGLRPGQAEALAAEDPRWLVDGKRGVVHLVAESHGR